MIKKIEKKLILKKETISNFEMKETKGAAWWTRSNCPYTECLGCQE